MKEVFLQIIGMSISASWLVLAVVFLRLVLKKAPKFIHCILWAMVALRLVCPTFPESEVSLIPDSAPVISGVLTSQEMATDIEAGQTVLPPAQIPQFDVPQQIEPEGVQWGDVLTIVWLTGVAAMACYGVASYLLLRKKVAPSVLEDGVWLCDDVATPFILGFFRPRVYLPSGLDEACKESVLAHEKAHLRRKDHWWKPLGFALLSIHWFNAVMWLAYILLCRDIEAACDERVIKQMDEENRKRYSEALLQCAATRRSIAACPLAFGEQGVKGRIKAVLSYKKPTVWIILAAIVVASILAACFLTDPQTKQDVLQAPVGKRKEMTVSLNELRERVPQYFELNGKEGLELYIWEENATIWSGLRQSQDQPISQEELDDLVGIKLSAMETIYTSTYWDDDLDIHLIGEFETLKEIAGPDLSNDEIEILVREEMRLTTCRLYGEDCVDFCDTFYYATEKTVGQEKLGLCLEESTTLVSCIFDPNVVKPRYTIYTVKDKGLSYLAVAEISENMVFRLYERRDPMPEVDNTACVGMVYFDLYDEPNIGSFLYKLTSTRYAVAVTQAELDMLTAMPAEKEWTDPHSFDFPSWYDGWMKVIGNEQIVRFTLSRNGIEQEQGYARLTEKERLLIESLKSRASIVRYNTTYVNGDYTASTGSGPYLQLNGENFILGQGGINSNSISGTVKRKNGKVILTSDGEKTDVFVFDVERHMLIYRKTESNQAFLDLLDETVFRANF